MSLSAATTVKDVIQSAHELNASSSPRLDVEVLLAHVLQKDRSFIFAHPEYCLTASEKEDIRRLLDRRKTGEPIAHLLGEKEFWSLPLLVNSTTLIPRPETELLVELVVERLKVNDAQPKEKQTILDLGTGTGAIALALAHAHPKHHFVAVDKTSEVVDLVRKNTQNLNLSNVEITESDWFSAINPTQQFNVIVSNPPYVAADDPHLLQGDVAHEPRSALVAEHNGLSDLKHIIEYAPNYLKPGGCLYLEHGYGQATGVRDFFDSRGFEKIQTEVDLSGQPRVTWAFWGGSI